MQCLFSALAKFVFFCYIVTTTVIETINTESRKNQYPPQSAEDVKTTQIVKLFWSVPVILPTSLLRGSWQRGWDIGVGYRLVVYCSRCSDRLLYDDIAFSMTTVNLVSPLHTARYMGEEMTIQNMGEGVKTSSAPPPPPPPPPI